MEGGRERDRRTAGPVPSGLGDPGWCRSPGAWAGSGPQAGRVWGRWAGCARSEPPWTWPSSSRLPEPTVSRPRGLSCSRANPSAPKGRCGLWAGGASQIPRGSVCPGGGIQPPPLGFPPEDSSLCRAVWQELGCVWGSKLRRKKDTQALGVSILINTPGTGPWGSGCPGNRSWAGRNAAALWPFPVTTPWKPVLMGPIFTRPAGLEMTPALKKCPGVNQFTTGLIRR